MSGTSAFPLGKTYYGESGTIDVSSSYANVGGVAMEGLVCNFNDTDPSDVSKLRSSDVIETRIVRNASGATLYGSRLAAYDPANRLKRVNGYARIAGSGNVAGVIDPALTAGVRDGDLFHVITKGYVLVKTPKTGAEFGSTAIAAGDQLFACTHTTALATTSSLPDTAGRIRGYATFTATETTDGTASQYTRNVLATAISAATSGQTDASLLVHVCVPRV